MKNYRYIFSVFFLLTCADILLAQSKEAKEKIKQKTNISELKKIENYERKENIIKKNKIDSLSKQNGWELEYVDKNGTYFKLVDLDENNLPVYYQTLGTGKVYAAKSTRTDHLNTGGSLGLGLNGEGMTIGVWDLFAPLADGATYGTHQEFYDDDYNLRVNLLDFPYEYAVTNPDGISESYSVTEFFPQNPEYPNYVVSGWVNLSFHSTCVVSVIASRGADLFNHGEAKGMASKCIVNSHDLNKDIEEVAWEAGQGLLISNHSYGFIDFNNYHSKSKQFDEIMYNAPYYLAVFAGGNWLDQLNVLGLSKNSLSVAGLKYVDVDAGGNITGAMTPYEDPIKNDGSSYGPSSDMRIKPDISGIGYQVSVATSQGYDKYSERDDLTGIGGQTGTSFAAPNVSGSLLLLQQHYNNVNNGNFMRAATLKGLALHTADDDQTNPGPDVHVGWGLLNSKKAAEVISQNGISTKIEERNLENNTSHNYTIHGNGGNMSVSISWTDPAFQTNSSYSGKTLLNDLDVMVIQGTNTFYPYRLINNGTANATNGTNDVDPFERIDILNATGDFTIIVTHKGNLLCTNQNGGTYQNQNYSLIITGIDNFVSNTADGNFVACTPPTCAVSLSISDAVTIGNSEEEAEQTITATNAISLGASATYHAGNSVTMEPGFMADYGSDFSAYIGGCGVPLSYRTSYLGSEIDEVEKTESVVKRFNTVKVYPNPCSINSIDIVSNFESTEELVKIDIIDYLGRKMKSLTTQNSKESVDVSSLTTGVYQIIVSQGSSTAFEKLVIIR